MSPAAVAARAFSRHAIPPNHENGHSFYFHLQSPEIPFPNSFIFNKSASLFSHFCTLAEISLFVLNTSKNIGGGWHSSSGNFWETHRERRFHPIHAFQPARFASRTAVSGKLFLR